jgi:hypothetical protein
MERSEGGFANQVTIAMREMPGLFQRALDRISRCTASCM